MITKAALAYFSPTGGTKHVLSAVGEGLGLPCSHIDMTLPAQRSQDYAVDAETLLVLGFPVYYGRVAGMQEQILPRITGTVKYVLPIVVYGNRAYDDAVIELADLCLARGWTLAAAAAFIAEHSYTAEMGGKRPDDADRELAVRFGAAVAASLKAGKVLDSASLPGNRPYKIYGPKPPIAPTTDPELCIRCGICSEVCPNSAIAFDDPLHSNPTLCILCAACIKRCPENARAITFPAMVERIKAMAELNREPKQPRLFLPK